MPRRYIVVGDVHGCIDELKELVDAIQPTSMDAVIFVGDLVDKGPDSAGVVRYVQQMAKRVEVRLVEGNHEEKHRRWRYNRDHRPDAFGQMQNVTEVAAIQASLTDEDREYLDTAVPWWPIDEFGAIVVHAGIPPDCESLPPRSIDALAASKDGKRLLSQLQRIRHVDSDGLPRKLGEEQEGDLFWADVYDGRFGYVYFGHHAFVGPSAPVRFPHAASLDLGAVYGGFLVAAIIDESGVLYRTVQAKSKYAEFLRA